jgi:CheY-like chemotaxis protein
MSAPESKTPVQPVTSPTPSGAPEAPGGRPPGILLVDDSAVVRSLMAQVLRREGFEVWAAADGRQALELYGQHRGRIDLVILDKGMPGLDGLETLDALLRLDPYVRCCFLTGDVLNAAEPELRRRGAMHVLYKPVAPEQIADVVRGLLRRPRGDAPPA